MDDLECKVGKQLKPTRLTARELCLCLEVSKGSVVGLDNEVNTDQVMSPLL